MEKHLKSKYGFSLAETLMAILILLMVTSVVATGIPTAANVFFKAVDASHAQVLLSTTMASLRDELSTATEVSPAAGGNSVSYKDSRGIRSEIKKDNDNKKIVLVKDKTLLETDEKYERLLVSDKAATSDMYATFTGITISDGIVTITGLRVMKGQNEIAALGDDASTYTIRVIRMAS